MGSLRKKYTDKKLFGQVYTPPFVVKKMLDEVGYASPHILGKRIVDPACGDGRFLVEVARRIIEHSPPEDLKKNLSRLTGWDIDAEAVEHCKRHLDQVTEALGISVQWNIFVVDALRQLPAQELFTKQISIEPFEFIVGNPPYIRIQHLSAAERGFIQSQYRFCKSGSTDIFIAFFELAYQLLSERGVCAFITPNTYFYTETARAMRDFFTERGSLEKIINYGDIQLFENATTYSAVTVFTKDSRSEFEYHKATSETGFQRATLLTQDLKGQNVWRLSIENSEKKLGKKLGEICRIHVGITTLCDKAYIFPVEIIDDKTVWALTKLRGRVQLERSILKPIVKGSTLKRSGQPIREWVLFPYRRENGRTTVLPEAELQASFPLAYQYLCSVRTELDKRDNGKLNPVAWYAFGRRQSLETGFGKKIIFSPMNRTPNFVLHDAEDATVYSGYFIKYDGDYESLLLSLNSDEMERFVAVSSRDFRGSWKAYSKKVVAEFVVPAGNA